MKQLENTVKSGIFRPMNNLQLQYLREMGIDVWQLRKALPRLSEGLATETLASDGPAKSELASQPSTERSMTVSGSASKIAASLVPLGDGAESRSRSESDQPLESATPSTASKLATNEEQPRFLFCFLDYESLSLMFSLDVNVAALPADVRQFADDVNFAVNPGEHRIPRVRDLRWPMVRASHIKQNEADARQVVQQKISQCCRRLVVFGSRAASYVNDSDGNPVLVEGQELLVAEDVLHYFAEPQDKRDLWQLLQEFSGRAQISNQATEL